LFLLLSAFPFNKFLVVSNYRFPEIFAYYLTIPCPTFTLFLRYNHQYMTTAIGGGFPRLNKYGCSKTMRRETRSRHRTDLARDRFRPGLSRFVKRALLPLQGRFAVP
jgi:hypothetical protein